MANNPRWCRPLGVWKDYFSQWAGRAEEQEMLDISTFLDLRRVTGELDPVAELRVHLYRQLDGRPALFAHLARQALSFKAPLRLFGNLILPGGDREPAGLLDLKAAMMPVVNYARLFALRNGVAATATPDRLAALHERGLLPPSRYQDILAVYGSLLRLRLTNQSATVEKGVEPDNLIDPALLGRMDDAILRESFNEIEHFQEQIKQTFLGGAERIG
jgi:CBS domain-containing protein